jgi:His/Glu/Gln/Arg/opine family amino acid ABC transporter permease subunit
MTNLLNYLPDLLHGLLITLILMLASVFIGLILAVAMTFCNMVENYFLNKSIKYWVLFICGTPLLVQIFIIYYGAGQFAMIRNSWFWIILREPMDCAIIALSINTSCYTYVLLKAAINSVPKNEIAACQALGMSKSLAFRRIILPRAFRIVLPAYSNEVIMVLKSTSLASTITLLDLMGVTQELIAQTYDIVTLYMIAGILYLIINTFILSLFKLLGKWNAIPNQ